MVICLVVDFPLLVAKPEVFSTWLQGELKRRDWSISHLSRKSKISDAHLSRLLSGSRKPGVEALMAIAQALDLPIALVYRRAGLLPPTGDEPDTLEQEWLHVFRKTRSQQEQQELLEHARFMLQQIQARKS